MLQHPKVRGALTTVFSGSAAGLMNLLGVSFGLSAQTSTVLSFYIFGSILAYTVDILFAKKYFAPHGGGPLTIIPYKEIRQRFGWLIDSFATKYFFRFTITVLIDTLIGLTLLSALLKYMDKYDIHFRWRDTIVAGFVAIFTFVLYNNALRFDWAYAHGDDKLLNTMVLMWTTIIIMLFSLGYNAESETAIPPPIRSSWFWTGVSPVDKKENIV